MATNTTFRWVTKLVHKRTGRKYELVGHVQHAKTRETICIYKSVEWSKDSVTGKPLPAGTMWAREQSDLYQKFDLTVVQVEDNCSKN